MFCPVYRDYVLFFFFFSSRRRHTRCSRDWSSDVCSSDLSLLDIESAGFAASSCLDRGQAQPTPTLLTAGRDGSAEAGSGGHLPPLRRSQIGRASCRERV